MRKTVLSILGLSLFLLVACPPKPVLPTLKAEHIKNTMAQNANYLQECFIEHKVPGLVDMRVTILGKTGEVLKVVILGQFEGTATGKCLEQAVNKIEFPPCQELTVERSYSVWFK